MKLFDILVGSYGLDHNLPDNRIYDERMFNFTETGYIFDNVAKTGDAKTISYEVIGQPKEVNMPVSLKVSLNKNHNNMESMMLNSRTYIDTNKHLRLKNSNNGAYNGTAAEPHHPIDVVNTSTEIKMYPTNLRAVEVEIPDKVYKSDEEIPISELHNTEYHGAVVLTCHKHTQPTTSDEFTYNRDVDNYETRTELDIGDVSKFKNIPNYENKAKVIYNGTYSLIEPANLI